MAHVARELAVRPEQLRVWAQDLAMKRGSASVVPGESLEQEICRLRRENETCAKRTRSQKSAVYFAKESR